MSDPHTAKWRLIAVARLVAVDPSDENVSKLLSACFEMPFSEMPREFLNAPIVSESLTGKTLCEEIFGDPTFFKVDAKP